jgi:nitrous oxidase accessory protein NosD
MKSWLNAAVLFGLMLMIACSSAIPAGRNGSKDFVIQEAIDCAMPGDRIEVASGTYFENPVISTKISLVGIGNPVIDAGKKGSALTILYVFSSFSNPFNLATPI